MTVHDDKSTVEKTLPLMEHLTELRKRLIYIMITLVVVFALCYWKSIYIFTFITAPIRPFMTERTTLTTLKLTEGFVTELKLCLMAAVVFSMPFILYQLWKFISPGLYRNERRYMIGFVISATFLFFVGAAFAYYVVFPFGFKFFLSYNTEAWGLMATLSIAWYLSFVMQLILAFGLVFELPVIVFFLTKMGLVKTEMLTKNRRFAIVIIFIVAAVLTPPDVVSQIAMAIPLLFLYEISIWITKVFGKKTEKTDTLEIYD